VTLQGDFKERVLKWTPACVITWWWQNKGLRRPLLLVNGSSLLEALHSNIVIYNQHPIAYISYSFH